MKYAQINYNNNGSGEWKQQPTAEWAQYRGDRSLLVIRWLTVDSN